LTEKRKGSSIVAHLIFFNASMQRAHVGIGRIRSHSRVRGIREGQGRSCGSIPLSVPMSSADKQQFND